MRALALAAAVAAPLAFGVGSVLQKAAADAVDRAGRLRLSLLGALAHQWRYLLGIVVDLAGWLLQIVALTALPVFVVQAFVITSAACTATLSAVLLGAPLPRRGWTAIAITVAGGAAVAITAPAGAPVRLGTAGWAVAVAALTATAATGGWITRRAPGNDGALLGVTAGLAFSLAAVLSKAVAPVPGGPPLATQVAALAITPTPYLLAAAGILATLLYATGLQRAHVTTVEAPLVVTELLVPIAVGVTLLAEPFPTGPHAAVMIAGMTATLAGVVLLLRAQPVARSSETDATPARYEPGSTAP